MAKVYVVKGSDDGVIGVYGSRKSALECAKRYCGDDCDVETSSWGTSVYGNSCSADIESWQVNADYI